MTKIPLEWPGSSSFSLEFWLLRVRGLNLAHPHLLLGDLLLASFSSHPWLFLHLERPCTRGETLCIATWTSGYAHGRCYPSSGGCIPERCVPGLGVDLGPFGQEILGSGGLVQKGRHGLQGAAALGVYILLIHGERKVTCWVTRWQH